MVKGWIWSLPKSSSQELEDLVASGLLVLISAEQEPRF